MRSVIGAACAAATAAVLAGCALLGDTVDKTREAERVVSAYRIDAMLAQAAPIVVDSTMGQLPAGPDAAERERLQRAIEAAYEPETLKQAVVGHLADQARAEGRETDLRRAAEQLETDLARDMIAREDAAGDEEFAQGFQQFLQKPADEESDRAVARMRNLAEDLRLVELQTAFNLGMLRGMVAARNTVVSDDYSISSDSEQRMLEETRASFDTRLSDQIPVMLLYVYRDVSEEQRAAYAELQNREALRWVNGALADGVDAALSAAAARVSTRYHAMAEDA